MAKEHTTDEDFANETNTSRGGRLSPGILKLCTPTLHRHPWDERQKVSVLQALIYAIACIQALPEDRQDYSTMRYLCNLVCASASSEQVALILAMIEHKLGREIELFEEPDDDEVEYLGYINYMRQLTDEHRQEFESAGVLLH